MKYWKLFIDLVVVIFMTTISTLLFIFVAVKGSIKWVILNLFPFLKKYQRTTTPDSED